MVGEALAEVVAGWIEVKELVFCPGNGSLPDKTNRTNIATVTYVRLGQDWVRTAQFLGGQDGEGQDGGGWCLGLGIVFVAQGLEGIVYNAKGRYDARQHSGHYFFRPRDR